jgi:hypothetical protein
MKRLLLALVAVMVVALPRSAWAHAAPHSILLLDLRANEVGVELRMPVPELEAAFGRPLEPEGGEIVVREREALRGVVARDLRAVSPNGASWTIEVDALEYVVADQVPVVVATAALTPPPGQSPRAFTIIDDVIGKEVANHTTWIGLRSDFAQGVVGGTPTFLGVTHYLHHAVVVDRRDGGALRGFAAVFRMGVQHIAEGTDHLLFLLTLLLPAPLLFARGARPRWGAAASVRASVVNVLRVVTAFTVGHSLTLLVGALGWVRLASAPVETLIAGSILVSAMHAVRPVFPGREAWIAAGFGLVHGLAFAGSLTELHLDAAHLALALVGFNLGIEAMQVAVIVLVLPWLLLLARTSGYRVLRVGGAIAAGVASVGWIGQRALHLPNPVEALVATIAAHPRTLLMALASVSIAVRLVDGRARPSEHRISDRSTTAT